MRTVKVVWDSPEVYEVRLDGVALKFKKGTATGEVDGKEHYVSWSAWGKPNTQYAFEVSVAGASVYKTPKDRKIGKKQVAFGAITVKAAQ